jgi:hypothetical protein
MYTITKRHTIAALAAAGIALFGAISVDAPGARAADNGSTGDRDLCEDTGNDFEAAVHAADAALAAGNTKAYDEAMASARLNWDVATSLGCEWARVKPATHRIILPNGTTTTIVFVP